MGIAVFDCQYKTYRDKNGEKIFIARSFNGQYGSFRAKKSGSLQRVKSSALPMVNTLAAAQSDLDKYAVKNGFCLFEDEMAKKP
jgi:VCBS repeat-containing protein